MDWKSKRAEDINTRIFNKVELLAEYEKKFDYESEPTEKRKLKDTIQKLKEEIENISSEIKQLQTTQDSEELDRFSSSITPDLDQIRQQYYDEYIKRKSKEKN
ncbi:MAG: hypothetical protein WBA77_09150 [Microcoleaceae cyanobacterium]